MLIIEDEISDALNVFLLTYDMHNGKSIIDIFNDFTAASRIRVPSEKVEDIVDFIRSATAPNMDLEGYITAAEIAGLIPRVTPLLKNKTV